MPNSSVGESTLDDTAQRTPYIVGIGGTTATESSTESALRIALAAAEAAGARTKLFGGSHLVRLPHYSPGESNRSEAGRELLHAIRAADGLLIASPGYHGSVSGLVKNALDYLEDTARDSRTYLDGMPVGVIATAYGWQATGSTLATLRSIIHALRGWPTPFGAAVNCSGGILKEGRCSVPEVTASLELVGRQVCDFARRHARNLI